MISITRNHGSLWLICVDNEPIVTTTSLVGAATMLTMALRLTRQGASDLGAVYAAIREYDHRGRRVNYVPFIKRMADYPHLWAKCEKYVLIYEQAKVDKHFKMFHEPFPF
jgi:hypothetical protein